MTTRHPRPERAAVSVPTEQEVKALAAEVRARDEHRAAGLIEVLWQEVERLRAQIEDMERDLKAADERTGEWEHGD